MGLIRNTFIYKMKISTIIGSCNIHYKEFYSYPEKYLYQIVERIKGETEESQKEYFIMYADEYDNNEITKFLQYLNSTDTDEVVNDLLTYSKFDLIAKIFKGHVFDYQSRDDIISDRGIVFFNKSINPDYFDGLNKLNIGIVNVYSDYWILDISKLQTMSTGVNGIALRDGDDVIKITLNDDEINTSLLLMESGSILQPIKKYFSTIYDVQFFDNENKAIILKEYLDGDFIRTHDKNLPIEDKLVSQPEYKVFEDYLKENDLWLDVHDGNGIAFPHKKDVPFMYFDY